MFIKLGKMMVVVCSSTLVPQTRPDTSDQEVSQSPTALKPDPEVSP